MGARASRPHNVEKIPAQAVVTRARGFSSSTTLTASPYAGPDEKDLSSNGSTRLARFRWEDGRRFHAVDGSTYSLPNDEREMDRLTRLHFLLRWSLDDLHKAPVRDILPGAKVLDVGCGPGTWLLDMAHEYPATDLYGVDISAVYPELIHPKNVRFQFGNVLEKLPFDDGMFDFVRMSMLVAGIPEQSWPRVVTELMRVTKKGGWIELIEMDLTPRSMGPIQTQIVEKLHLGFRSRGLDVGVARRLGRIESQAGLIEVCTSFISIPCNWGQPKSNLGELMRDNVEEYLWSVEPMLSKALGIFDAEKYGTEVVRPYIEESAGFKSFYNYHYAYGQVPE